MCLNEQTGIRVDGKKGWYRAWQCGSATYIVFSANRGIATIESNFPSGLPNAVPVHDCWAEPLPHSVQDPPTVHRLPVARTGVLHRTLRLAVGDGVQETNLQWAETQENDKVGQIRRLAPRKGWDNRRNDGPSRSNTRTSRRSING
jgi:hypothetical protein